MLFLCLLFLCFDYIKFIELLCKQDRKILYQNIDGLKLFQSEIGFVDRIEGDTSKPRVCMKLSILKSWIDDTSVNTTETITHHTEIWKLKPTLKL